MNSKILSSSDPKPVKDFAAYEYQQKLQKIIENDVNGVIVLTELGVIQFANPAAAEMFGKNASDLIGELFGLPMAVDKVTQIEIIKQGKPCPVEMRITTITWPEDPALLVSLYDLSERIKFEKELERKSTHDALTDLPGESLLLQSLSQSIHTAQRSNTQIVILAIQLSRLDMISASLGSSATDALQIEIGKRLEQLHPLANTVARIQNEKFIYVMDGLSDSHSVSRLVSNVTQSIKIPYTWQGTSLSIEPYIGVSIYPKDAEDSKSLLQSAEVALFQSKQNGRSGVTLASNELNDQLQNLLMRETALRRALENHEFEMFYQARVNLKTGRIAGAEALMRWKDPEKGLIQPIDFISLAEQTGLIIPMTEWALDQVCRQQKTWLNEGINAVPISVNLVAEHFRNEMVLETIKNALKNNDLAPQFLELEVTESAAMSNAAQTIDRLKSIREMGIMIALDDFGTGYSSLSYLERFPIDILKIDISFVRGILTNPHDAAITTAIIAMAHELDFMLVAEGVEHEGQRQFLARHQCEEGQGYLFSKPIPTDDFRALLKNNWVHNPTK